MKPLFTVDLNSNDRGISMPPDGSRSLTVPIRQSTSGTTTLVTRFDTVLSR